MQQERSGEIDKNAAVRSTGRTGDGNRGKLPPAARLTGGVGSIAGAGLSIAATIRVKCPQ